MSRRFVFVPIFGDVSNGSASTPEAYLASPHVKAWGVWNEQDEDLTVIHTEPPCEAVKPGEAVNLFEPEREAMVDITDDDDIPTEVAVALARMALLPVRQAD